jgi:hypothetical protein
LIALASLAPPSPAQPGPWPAEKARAWYDQQPWPVGCNFSPSTAINQLEMWQKETWDPETIARELDWAQGLGFNTTRVFLHDLAYTQDPDGFLQRLDQFLALSAERGIKPMLVLFDSVWDPFPKAGPQRAPKPGLHNSGWVQGPGIEILKDPARVDALKTYVQAVVGKFKNDPRVLAWDLINEPDNRNGNSYGKHEPENKAELAMALLEKTFKWCRELSPIQPLTCGVWVDDWSEANLKPIHRMQLEQSDIITYHSYNPLPHHQKRIEPLRAYNRPILCTEFMARPEGSTFDPILGYMKDQKIGAYCWGFVAGKTNTIFPWDSWQKPYDGEPPVWFHDIFRPDGTPYRPEEVAYIRSLTGAKAPSKP